MPPDQWPVVQAALSLQRRDWAQEKSYKSYSTVKQLQNHSLFILPPVSVKYYCLFLFDTLSPNPQGAFCLTAVPFPVLLNGPLVRLRCHVPKDKCIGSADVSVVFDM